MSAATDKGVLESLAGWCNEKNIGKPEYDRRSAAYDTVAELIEAGERASALIKAQGDLIEEYRTSGKCPHAVASQAVNLMHERNGLVTTGAINNSAKFDAALARCKGAQP